MCPGEWVRLYARDCPGVNLSDHQESFYMGVPETSFRKKPQVGQKYGNHDGREEPFPHECIFLPLHKRLDHGAKQQSYPTLGKASH